MSSLQQAALAIGALLALPLTGIAIVKALSEWTRVARIRRGLETYVALAEKLPPNSAAGVLAERIVLQEMVRLYREIEISADTAPLRGARQGIVTAGLISIAVGVGVATLPAAREDLTSETAAAAFASLVYGVTLILLSRSRSFVRWAVVAMTAMRAGLRRVLRRVTSLDGGTSAASSSVKPEDVSQG